MTLISLFLLAALLPYLSHSASVEVGIVNGTEVKPHSRPYMVSIQKKRKHVCGGFLVSEKFVMTAAHCRKKIKQLTVVLGAHDLSNKKDGSIRMKVKKYYRHPDYNIDTHDNDIMLLKLRGRAKKSKTVNWISIPKRNEDIKTNTVCSVAGWGRTGSFKSGSNRLLETKITIVAKKQCKKLWENYLTRRMVCAVHPGGSCKGDSGGPLVCGDIAVGIVSFGQKNMCDAPTKPKIFAKISAFLPWIKSIIGKV
ncbi:granzyme B(G,H)-like [Pygocentrus nattereri]|uniref:Peptidase S1 domain-containing protein n=1 Tax=Pygocentrus nattereri TaxID=42514 RepID=A0A3B4CTD8_PYGNA|nr:granzyme B(G,H)-like [Pygocentrus nattereri]